MLKNIAVVLRGHIRTWQYNHRVVFDFYSSIAENVDYYLSTWNTPNIRQVKLEKPFTQHNITPKAVCKVDYQAKQYTSWGGPALLSLHAVPHVRQQHKLTPYDAVFDTRFDVITARTEFPVPNRLQDDTLYTTQFTNLVDKNGDRNIGVMDHMMVSKPEVFFAMADRIIIGSQTTKECHVDMLEFAQKQGFKVSNSLKWLHAEMTRPVDAERYTDPFAFLQPGPPDNDHWPPWHELSVEQRKQVCKDNDIEEIDYITNNGNISVGRPDDELFDQLKKVRNTD